MPAHLTYLVEGESARSRHEFLIDLNGQRSCSVSVLDSHILAELASDLYISLTWWWLYVYCTVLLAWNSSSTHRSDDDMNLPHSRCPTGSTCRQFNSGRSCPFTKVQIIKQASNNGLGRLDTVSSTPVIMTGMSEGQKMPSSKAAPRVKRSSDIVPLCCMYLAFKRCRLIRQQSHMRWS